MISNSLLVLFPESTSEQGPIVTIFETQPQKSATTTKTTTSIQVPAFSKNTPNVTSAIKGLSASVIGSIVAGGIVVLGVYGGYKIANKKNLSSYKPLDQNFISQGDNYKHSSGSRPQIYTPSNQNSTNFNAPVQNYDYVQPVSGGNFALYNGYNSNEAKGRTESGSVLNPYNNPSQISFIPGSGFDPMISQSSQISFVGVNNVEGEENDNLFKEVPQPRPISQQPFQNYSENVENSYRF
ncbi:hypothetical protein HK096_009359 [Nowakowskiella sp. JEL0078]|nr:hypothetical protein HK096_009359 [Nowakowskiella sp. JEL0078]